MFAYEKGGTWSRAIVAVGFGLQTVDGRGCGLKARKEEMLVPMRLRMLGYASFPLKPNADAIVRSCLSGGRFEDASPLPFQNRFSLLIFRLLLPYSRLSSPHPLSHPPYPTCRIGHTTPLPLKNTNAPLVISRPGTN